MSTEGTSRGARESLSRKAGSRDSTRSPSCKGGLGDLPRQIFLFMAASMCVFDEFWKCFGPEFQPSWAALEQVALAYP